MVWHWKLNSQECIGCGICADVCPDDAIILTREMVYPQAAKPCVAGACNRCVQECPTSAIELTE